MGTYNNATALSSVSQCRGCPPGTYGAAMGAVTAVEGRYSEVSLVPGRKARLLLAKKQIQRDEEHPEIFWVTSSDGTSTYRVQVGQAVEQFEHVVVGRLARQRGR